MTLFLRILPSQIPTFWDHIKFAVSKVNSLEGIKLESYLNIVLVRLLNEKESCFIRVSEDRELMAVVLTRFMTNPITENKTLLLDLIYSFKVASDSEWIDNMKVIKKYASNSGCDEIMAYSYIPRMFEILEMIGMKHTIRLYSCDVERKE
jgi:hypothetical protein